METVINHELQLAADFVQYTNRNIFLTGKAGTGKTTFLHNLKKSSPKRMIVVAPTGVAAINAGGVTIHSFFQLPFHPHIPSQYLPATSGDQVSAANAPTFKLNREKIRIIKGLDLLVIDEISMVRADLLDVVDLVLRRYKNHNHPFGGVQLLMIGDIQQLAPVVKEDDREILDRYYHTAFFFGSLALQNTDYVTIELKHIYRQQDQTFINLLNKIRDNQLDSEAFALLNKRYDPHFNADSDGGYITLTTHNAQAQNINDSKLGKLPGKAYSFTAIIQDDFPEYAFPTPKELILKKGAQVMFVKNDISKEKLFFNGKIGKVIGFEKDYIVVQCPEDNHPIMVEMAEWQNMKYSLNEDTKEIEETVIGTFTQYPLKLAWAITIHKSQGLTFNKAIIDARAAFAHGQVYVALSRCRTLDGLVLSTPISQYGIISDPAVSGFVRETEQNQPDQNTLNESKSAYQQMLLNELFNFQSIVRGLSYCLKLANEYQEHVVGNLSERLEKIMSTVNADLVTVSGKFQPQLNHLLSLRSDAETNEALQERIKKACIYFSDKLAENLQEIINGLSVETDNKAVQKLINEALERVRQETMIKLACLQTTEDGFCIRDYLRTKARTAIEITPAKPKAGKTFEDISGSVKHPELYKQLLAWRNNKAMETGLPHYMILPQKTMASIAALLPQSVKDLKQVKGMGNVKSEKYGEEILTLIGSYCRKNHVEPPQVIIPEDQKPSRVKTDTKQLTYNLYKTGKTIQEIAGERELTTSTIENHLAHFIGTGDIPVHEFVSPDITKLIAEHLGNSNSRQLGPVKAALGEQVSWSEIRFVMKHLEYLRKRKE